MTADDPTAPWDAARLRGVAEAAIDDFDARVEAASQAAERAVAAHEGLLRLDAIRALHRPTADGLCRECCLTSDDVQSEDCADLHDHSEGQPICPTRSILDADLDGAP